jgi:hypothetical protein
MYPTSFLLCTSPIELPPASRHSDLVPVHIIIHIASCSFITVMRVIVVVTAIHRPSPSSPYKTLFISLFDSIFRLVPPPIALQNSSDRFHAHPKRFAQYGPRVLDRVFSVEPLDPCHGGPREPFRRSPSVVRTRLFCSRFWRIRHRRPCYGVRPRVILCGIVAIGLSPERPGLTSDIVLPLERPLDL